MNYIDKLNTPNARQGVTATQDFIDRCWNGASYENEKLTYKKYKCANDYRIKKLLVQEQYDAQVDASLCCYCMRKLFINNGVPNHSQNVTLEHIIPHHISQSDWDDNRREYQKYENLDASHVVVCIGGELSNTTTQISSLPHPHFISYYNLVASCDGAVLRSFSECSSLEPSHCCNNKRGKAFVKPLYLKADQASQVYYDEKGIVYFPDEKRESGYENILNLNDVALKMAREFWYYISRSDYNVSQIENACDDEKLREEILDDAMPGADTKWEFLKKNKDAWCWISEYSWFYDYYRTHYPLVNTPA